MNGIRVPGLMGLTLVLAACSSKVSDRVSVDVAGKGTVTPPPALTLAQSIETVVVSIKDGQATLGVRLYDGDIRDQQGKPMLRLLPGLSGKLDETLTARLASTDAPDFVADLQCNDEECHDLWIRLENLKGTMKGSLQMHRRWYSNLSIATTFGKRAKDAVFAGMGRLARMLGSEEPKVTNLIVLEVEGGKSFFDLHIGIHGIEPRQIQIGGIVGRNEPLRIGFLETKGEAKGGQIFETRGDVTHQKRFQRVAIAFGGEDAVFVTSLAAGTKPVLTDEEIKGE